MVFWAVGSKVPSFSFRGRVSLCTPGRPGTLYIDQPVLPLTKTWMLGLKAWASKPSLKFVFKTAVSDFWECVEKDLIRWLTPFFHDHIHPVSFLGTVTFRNYNSNTCFLKGGGRRRIVVSGTVQLQANDRQPWRSPQEGRFAPLAPQPACQGPGSTQATILLQGPEWLWTLSAFTEV